MTRLTRSDRKRLTEIDLEVVHLRHKIKRGHGGQRAEQQITALYQERYRIKHKQDRKPSARRTDRLQGVVAYFGGSVLGADE